MTDLRALYQEVILDHNKKPRNFGTLEPCSITAHGFNPLCGDDYTIYANINDNVIEEIKFEGKGCAISKAAASMMTARVKGQPVDYAEALIEEFRMMMAGEVEDLDATNLKHLRVFEGVSQLPNRIKCAVLPWHTLLAAMNRNENTSTEGDDDAWSDEIDPTSKWDLF